MSATYSKRELGALMLQLIERRELAIIAGDSRAAKSASQAYQTVHATWLRTLQRESGAPARAPELSWVERHPDAGARILVATLLATTAVTYLAI